VIPRQITLQVVALSLLLGSCAERDIDLYLEGADIGQSDLTVSQEPGERAAGQSATELVLVTQAEVDLRHGIEQNDPDQIAAPGNLRPDDARYPIYELALLAGAKPVDGAQYTQAADRATVALANEYPDASESERDRIAVELLLSASEDIIATTTDDAVRAGMVEKYCRGLSSIYPDLYTDEFPSQVAFYLLVEADFSLCPG
jgi:hypothetical protein